MKKLYSALKYILLLSVAAVLLWASFRGVHWKDFTDGLRSADFYWIGASMLASVVAFWLRALRWRLVMMPLGFKIKKGMPGMASTLGISQILLYLVQGSLPDAG